MATSTPPQASKRPVGTASTPSQLSHSSPTATRHAAGKTPMNHPTTGSTGSKTLASTPMVSNLSQTGMISSPNANMLSFSTPSGLAVDGTTPAGLNIPTPALGGAAMMPTMSELGLTTSSAKRNEDEERRVKMRKVLKSIGRVKGRVSEEGIARIGRRVGFQNDIDVEKLTVEEMERKVGNRPISTAGNIIVIDVDLKDNVPQSVKVAFPSEQQALKQQEPLIAKVLFDDLRAPNEVPLERKLDHFTRNLERLAVMDRLSAKGINCFEALTGLYTSLDRLYNQEMLVVKDSLKDTTAGDDQLAETTVLRKKSGKPLIHERSSIGLEILYWCQNSKTTASESKDDNEIFALRIEAESWPAELYPSLRISDSWLPDPLQLGNAGSGEAIPWEDPPSTFTAAGGDASVIAMNGQQKLPGLRFVAKLDPPVVMPYQTAINVLATVGAPAPQMLAVPPQYAALLLNGSTGVNLQPAGVPFTRTAKQLMLSQKAGHETTVGHNYTLSSAKPDYGFKLEELPFSHPRQLVELLPTLRQWAGVGSFLTNIFANEDAKDESHETARVSNIFGALRVDNTKLDDLLATGANTVSPDNIPVNVSLVTSPIPTLGVAFSTSGGNQIGSVDVQVLPNADIVVTHHESISSHESEIANQSAQMLAKALDVCGDFGIWIEWMRNKQ